MKKLGETFNAKVIWERADGTFVDADGYDGIISEGVDRMGNRRFRAPKRDVHRSTRGDVKGAGRTPFNAGRTGGGVDKEGFIIWEGETPDNVLTVSLPSRFMKAARAVHQPGLKRPEGREFMKWRENMPVPETFKKTFCWVGKRWKRSRKK